MMAVQNPEAVIYDPLMKRPLSVGVDREREPRVDPCTLLRTGVTVKSCPFFFPRTERAVVFVAASVKEVEAELGCLNQGK